MLHIMAKKGIDGPPIPSNLLRKPEAGGGCVNAHYTI